MTQPLALVLYERLLPGSQLVNRLQDLKYRVQAVTDADGLLGCARQERPMVIFVDLGSSRQDVSLVVGQLKREGETQHIPVIAFGPEEEVETREAARKAGAVLVASDTAILSHLSELLEQALRVE